MAPHVSRPKHACLKVSSKVCPGTGWLPDSVTGRRRAKQRSPGKQWTIPKSDGCSLSQAPSLGLTELSKDSPLL